MTADWFGAAVDRVAQAGRGASEAMEALVGELEAIRVAHLTGRHLTDLADEFVANGIRERRIAAIDAFHEFERAVGAMRAHTVQSLVDEDGLGMSEVARKLRISRQAVARLYDASAESPDQGST